MFEIRTTGLDVPMETVDGVTAPRELLNEAKRLATTSRAIHYVGVIDKKNPEFIEPKVNDFKEVITLMAETLKPMHLRDKALSRYLMTGDFILSDDHSQVIAHKDCGRLVWVLPDALGSSSRP